MKSLANIKTAIFIVSFHTLIIVAFMILLAELDIESTEVKIFLIVAAAAFLAVLSFYTAYLVTKNAKEDYEKNLKVISQNTFKIIDASKNLYAYVSLIKQQAVVLEDYLKRANEKAEQLSDESGKITYKVSTVANTYPNPNKED